MRVEANQPAAPQQQSAEDPEGGSTLIGRRITGVIDSKSDADVFQFHGVQGETVRIAVNATFGGLDPAVTLSFDSEHIAPVALGPIAAGVCVCDNFTKTSSNLTKAGDPTTEVAAFARSDVFASVGRGVTRRYSPDGTLLQTLDSGTGSVETTGMAFDSAGNLYVTQFQDNSVFKFDINGNRIGPFGTGYSFPESIVIDLAQNIYISNAGANKLFKFNAAGTLLDTYTLEIEDRGVDWIDLAADQRTMFYTSEGKKIKRYDVVSKTQLPDFNATPLPGTQAFALRLLPGGGLIVADSQSVLRLDSSGNVVQSYDAPGEDIWFAVNLDSDGRSFWSGNIFTGKVYRFDIQSGAVLTSWDTNPLRSLAGLAVFGEITAAQVLNISKSVPPVAVTGEALTYTITFGNSGSVNATNVVIKDAVPAGTTFLSASDGGTLSGGVVTWNIGTLEAGVTGRTVSFTVRVNASSGSIVNNNYTIEATGIPPIAGPPATSVFPPKRVLIHDDNSGPGSNALIRVFQLPATGTYTVLVASSDSDSSGGYELLISPVDKNSNLSALALTPTEAPGDITVKTHSTRDVGKLISSVTAPSGMVVNFSGFSPDGSAVAVATGPAVGAGSTTISVLSSREGRVVFQETAPSGFVVTFLGFSPEGEAAAVAISPAGGPPTTIKVYSTRLTGELIFSETAPSGFSVSFLSFSPDGNTAALAVIPAGTALAITTKVYSNLDGRLVFSETAPSGFGVTFLGFSPDGEAAAVGILPSAGPATTTVKVYSTVDGKLIFSETAPSGFIVVFGSFSTDGDAAALAIGPASGPLATTVKVYSTRQAAKLIFSETAPSGFIVNFAAFAPDSRSMALTLSPVSGSPGATTLKVYSTREAGRQILSETAPSGSIVQFSGYSPDGETIALTLARSDGLVNTTVKVYNTRKGSLVFSETAPSGSLVNFAGFAPDGATGLVELAPAAGPAATALKLYSASAVSSLVFSETAPSGSVVTFLGFGPNGHTAALGIGPAPGLVTTTFKAYSTQTERQLILSETAPSGAGVIFFGFAPDGQSLALGLGGAATAPTTVKVYSAVETSKLRFSETAPSGSRLAFLGFNPDGAAAALVVAPATGPPGTTLKLYSARESSRLIMSETAPSGSAVVFLGFSPDGDFAALGVGGSPVPPSTTFKLYSTRENNKLVFGETAPSGSVVRFLGISLDSDAAAVGVAPRDGPVHRTTRVFSTRETNKLISSETAPSGLVVTFLGFSLDRTSLREAAAQETVAQILNVPILKNTTDTFTGLAFTNLGTDNAVLKLSAHDNRGDLFAAPGVENPVSTVFGGLEQLARQAPEFFRFRSDDNEGWVQATSDRRSIVGFELIGDKNPELRFLDGVDMPQSPAKAFVVSDVEHGSIYTTEIHVVNVTTRPNRITLDLRSTSGNSVGSFDTTLAAKAKLSRRIRDIFPAMPQPFEGYLIVRGEGDLVVTELLVSGSALAALNGHILRDGSSTPTRLFSAQMATGGNSIFTLINLVNPTSLVANIVVRVVGDDGANLAAPVNLTINPGQQFLGEARQMFGFNPNVTTVGSLIIESSISGIVGDVSFGDPSGANRFRSSLPLEAAPGRFAAFGHVATGFGFFTGVAAFNFNSGPIEILVKVYRADGSLSGSSRITLPANGRIAKQLHEIVESSANQAGGYFTLESDALFAAFALFGTSSGSALSTIPAQRLEIAGEVADNPVPSITSLSPNAATAGAAGFNLSVFGTNFVNGSIVRWNGSDRTTTFVSATQLTAAISASDLASPGNASVTVFNPAPGGGISGALTFTINAPVPAVSSLSPSSAAAGGAAFTLTVNGSNFVSTSVVRWNGSNRTTNFASATQVTASIPASDIAAAGTASVSVFNPAPGGGTSGSLTFTITAPPNPNPTLSALNPSTATAGGAAFTLTVSGTNFVSGSVVRWNGSDRSTTFASATQLAAAIPASDIATAGTATVTVFNPAPGGGTSNSLAFTINAGGAPSGNLRADYQFQNTRSSSVSGAPDLADLSPNTFVTATVDGTTRTVMRFAANDGLSLSPTTGVIPNAIYSVVILFAFDTVDGYRRVLDFKNGTSDTGVYIHNGKLAFFNTAEAVNSSVAEGSFVQVVVTRDGAKKVVGYVNGVKQLEFTDSPDFGLIDSSNTLRFFKDNTSGGSGNEASAGSVARIRLYNVALSESEVAGLDRLASSGGTEGTNLLRNPGAEDGSAGTGDVFPIPEWTVTSNFTAIRYGTPDFPTSAESQRIGGGNNFFGGGPNNALSTAVQTADVSSHASGIDAGQRTALLKAHLASFSSQGDSAAVRADFLSSGGSVLGSISIGPVSATNNVFRLEQASGAVPSGTRSIRVTMTATRAAGSYNDGYFDNIFLGLSSTGPAPAENPVPAISSLSPSSAIAGGSAFTLTVNGSGFVNESAVRWNGSNRGTNFASAAQLTASITAADIASAGSAAVTVFNPAPGGGVSNALTFTITAAAGPIIQVDPTSLDFGSVTVGQTRDLTLTVRNTGTAPLTVSSLSSSNARFAVISPATPFNVAAGGQQAVAVRFSPTSPGAQSGNLTISSNDPSRPSVAVPLSGSGAAPAGSAPTLSNLAVDGPFFGVFEVEVDIADPDGDIVRIEFEWFRGGVRRFLGVVNSPADVDLSGVTSGTLRVSFSFASEASTLDRLAVTAIDAQGNRSNTVSRNLQ